MIENRSGVTVSTSEETRFFSSPAEYHQYLKDNPTIFIEGFAISFDGNLTDEERCSYSVPSVESV